MPQPCAVGAGRYIGVVTSTIIAILLGLAAGALIGALAAGYRLRGALAAEQARTARIPELEAAARDREYRIEELTERLAATRAESAALHERIQQERAAAEERLSLLNDAQRKLGDAFTALSSEALHKNTERFLELARTVLERHQEATRTDFETRAHTLDSLVTPLHESLTRVDQRMSELEKARAEAQGQLYEQLQSLSRAHMQLQQETANLVKALRAPATRGRWGEIQLRRVVEMAGMVAYCDFVEQPNVSTPDGRLRPDLIIRLPAGRTIVVDSKTPLEAYLDAVEAETETERVESLRRHAVQVRAHVRKLSEKAYWEQFPTTPEMVVLFLPGESFYGAALERDPELIDMAVQQRILIATPITLIGLLKALAYNWQQEAIAANAQQVSELGRQLYQRVRTLAEHFDQLRRALDRTVGAYNKAVRSLEARVLPAARKFRELGAGSGDELGSIDAVERQPLRLGAADLTHGVDGEEEVVEPGPRIIQTEL